MLRRIMDKLQRFDWVLFIACLLLLAIGLAAIYSVSLSNEAKTGLTVFKKQLAFGAIGLVLLLVLGLVNYSAWRVYSRSLYAIMLVLLLAVLVFGSIVHGTRGWFLFGGLGFQPVELAKIALIITLAKFFSNRLQQFQPSKHLIVSFLLTMGLILLVLWQPDFGSAMILFGIWLGLLILTGVPKKYLLVLLVIAVVVAAVGWAVLLKDYQKERISVFLNPSHDPFGSGYNVSQSVIAIGSGRFFGRGLGFGSQSQLKFIPEAETDFIFAVIAEELGLLGVLLVLGLWAVVFWRLWRLGRLARDDFGLFLSLGMILLFFLHLFINVGMNMGLMPVAGISAPFLSYGGSFLIVSMMLIGMAESVAVHR